jgi:hypothetical protein
LVVNVDAAELVTSTIHEGEDLASCYQSNQKNSISDLTWYGTPEALLMVKKLDI